MYLSVRCQVIQPGHLALIGFHQEAVLPMKTNLEVYRESRDVLLNKIIDTLSREEKYTRCSISSLQSAREERPAALRELCNQQPILKGQVTQFLGVEPATPIAEFEKLFLLAHDAIYQA